MSVHNPNAPDEGGPPAAAAVLLVDDETDNLRALEALLAGQRYDLVRATSGEAALGLLAAREFAVVLLDVRMPGLDGFETARRIRARDNGRPVPIIFLTDAEDQRFPVDQA